jgi:hypothetical protein
MKKQSAVSSQRLAFSQAKGPNPLVVQQIFDRVAIFEAEEATKAAKKAAALRSTAQVVVSQNEAKAVQG